MAKGNKKTKNNQPYVTEAVEQQKKKEQERKEEVKQAAQQIPPKAKTSSEKKSPVKKSPESETVKKCNCGCKDCTCGKECNCGEECKCKCGCKDCNCGKECKCNCGCKDCNCSKECKCVKKECCCPFKCIFHHLYPLIIALLLSIGFVFYLIIRDVDCLLV